MHFKMLRLDLIVKEGSLLLKNDDKLSKTRNVCRFINKLGGSRQTEIVTERT
jgi:hypothetical protein